MDFLWTPWRYQYVVNSGGTVECIFCAAAQAADDKACLVVHRAAHNLIILNRFPYTSGHIMVAPYEHVPTLDALPDHTKVELIRLAGQCESHLRAIYRPEGLNLGMNIGKSAGAGVAGHVHLHVLPRWTGDTSFITTVAETRIVPEELEVTWEKLRAAFGA
ncbi:MAG TPA: HIT domain-containing protein [Bryobacteraceae bacterium]|nr:HIT domain-containing protein [Bryobacteraceae bacterium]